MGGDRTSGYHQKRYGTHAFFKQREQENLWYRFLGHMGDVSDSFILNVLKTIDPSITSWALTRASESGRVPPSHEDTFRRAMEMTPPFDHEARRSGAAYESM